MKKSIITIIAEAGVNHNGSIDTARKMIDAAVDAGADLVKFQTFKAEDLVIRSAKKAEYQKESSGIEESQFNMLKKLELDRAAHEELIQYCEQKGTRFLSTAFDHDSIDLLAELNIPFYKIPSGEITNLPYLRHVGRMGKPVVMSTGMATLDEVWTAMDVLLEAGLKKDDLVILHCNTEYPTPIEDVNLKAMLTIQDELEVVVGYSDHTLGIEIPIAAVALGAVVIEKHVTLSRADGGPDAAFSLEPGELVDMVRGCRDAWAALGAATYERAASEEAMAPYRRSLYVVEDIPTGAPFTATNLRAIRPGYGLALKALETVLGKTAKYELKRGTPLAEDMIEDEL